MNGTEWYCTWLVAEVQVKPNGQNLESGFRKIVPVETSNI